jgi:hypothetical protein
MMFNSISKCITIILTIPLTNLTLKLLNTEMTTKTDRNLCLFFEIGTKR